MPDQEYLQNNAVVAADWIGFLCLSGTAVYLFYKLTRFPGTEVYHAYYMGYNEEKMISMFVNLVAALAYWAKICSHANGDIGPAADVMAYKYFDYLLTCPLLTLDLLWTLNLPYKCTYAGFVFCCIVCAAMSSILEGNARYMWFAMGVTLFAFTFSSIIGVVRIRFHQFADKEVKHVRLSLKIACMTYFGIWCGYPSLWLLHDTRLISDVASALLHTVFDVAAKSLYGLALLSFVLRGEKSNMIFAPLTERPGQCNDDRDRDRHDHDIEAAASGSDRAASDLNELEEDSGRSRPGKQRERRLSYVTVVGGKTPRGRRPSMRIAVERPGDLSVVEPGTPNLNLQWLQNLKATDVRLNSDPRLSGLRQPSSNPSYLSSPAMTQTLPTFTMAPSAIGPLPAPSPLQVATRPTQNGPLYDATSPTASPQGMQRREARRGSGTGSVGVPSMGEMEAVESVQRQIQAVEHELAGIVAQARRIAP